MIFINTESRLSLIGIKINELTFDEPPWHLDDFLCLEPWGDVVALGPILPHNPFRTLSSQTADLASLSSLILIVWTVSEKQERNHNSALN